MVSLYCGISGAWKGFLSVYCLSQTSQWYGFSLLWIIWCLVRPSLSVNCLPQKSHWYGFSLLWNFWCDKVPLMFKLLVTDITMVWFLLTSLYVFKPLLHTLATTATQPVSYPTPNPGTSCTLKFDSFCWGWISWRWWVYSLSCHEGSQLG